MQGRRWILLVVAVGFAVVAATSCAPFTSWPQVETGVRTDPLLEPFPTLMTESIRYAHDEFEPGTAAIVYNLPDGTPASVYKEIDRRLVDAQPLQNEGDPALHVEAVRARGPSAEVDLVVPHPDGRYELVTVYFTHDVFNGWKLRDARKWRIPRDAPAPHYMADTTPRAVAGAPDPAGPQTP